MDNTYIVDNILSALSSSKATFQRNEIENIVQHESVDRLKIDEIKSIIKYFVVNSISTYRFGGVSRKKNALVEDLKQFIKHEKIRCKSRIDISPTITKAIGISSPLNTLAIPGAFNGNQATASSLPRNPFSNPVKTNPTAAAAHGENGNRGPITSFFSQPTPSTTSSSFTHTTNTNRNQLLNRAYLPPPSTVPPANLQQYLLLLLNTTHKRQMYEELKSQPGLKKLEILCHFYSLRNNDMSAMSVDDILMAILSKRHDLIGQGPTMASLQAQENAIYDRVLRESESERDNIAARKRKRKEVLRNDCATSILESDEFKNSILIHQQQLLRKCLDETSSNFDPVLPSICARESVITAVLKAFDISNCANASVDDSSPPNLQREKPSVCASTSSTACFNTNADTSISPTSNDSANILARAIASASARTSASAINANKITCDSDSTSAGPTVSSLSVTGCVNAPNQVASSKHRTALTSCCLCDENKMKLKSAFVTLFYLELDAVKFHGENCHHYFAKLFSRFENRFSASLEAILCELAQAKNSPSLLIGHNAPLETGSDAWDGDFTGTFNSNATSPIVKTQNAISTEKVATTQDYSFNVIKGEFGDTNNTLLSSAQQYFENIFYNVSDAEDGSGNSKEALVGANSAQSKIVSTTNSLGAASISQVIGFLDDEINTLRTGLYLRNEDGNLIPLIFRLCDPRYNRHGQLATAFNLEEDGFEIV